MSDNFAARIAYLEIDSDDATPAPAAPRRAEPVPTPDAADKRAATFAEGGRRESYMDPTANLRAQIRIAARVLTCVDEGRAVTVDDAEALADLAIALDAWIRKGGALPEQWDPSAPYHMFTHDNEGG